MSAGFVYVLINPAFPDSVKIGKTTRSPDDRAKELSAPTGVPTPFSVAYEVPFEDCNSAEASIHALLKERGFHRYQGREFFRVSVRDAIAIIREVESSSALAKSSDSASSSLPIVGWSNLLNEAATYEHGIGDTIQDEERAAALYRQAIKHGVVEAYFRLAGISGRQGKSAEAIRWLTLGAEKGAPECWSHLARIYTGETGIINVGSQLENARKAWRNFLKSVQFEDYPDNHLRIYSSIRRFVRLTRLAGSPEEDIKALGTFITRFEQFILLNRSEEEGRRLRERHNALIQKLLHRSIDAFNLREPQVKTRAKLLSISTFHAWWFSRLCEGSILSGVEWGNPIPSQDLVSEYISHAENRGDGKIRGTSSVSIRVGMFLQQVCPPGFPRKRFKQGNLKRQWHYEFPPLSECRNYFDKQFGGPFNYYVRF